MWLSSGALTLTSPSAGSCDVLTLDPFCLCHTISAPETKKSKQCARHDPTFVFSSPFFPGLCLCYLQKLLGVLRLLHLMACVPGL